MTIEQGKTYIYTGPTKYADCYDPTIDDTVTRKIEKGEQVRAVKIINSHHRIWEIVEVHSGREWSAYPEWLAYDPRADFDTDSYTETNAFGNPIRDDGTRFI